MPIKAGVLCYQTQPPQQNKLREGSTNLQVSHSFPASCLGGSVLRHGSNLLPCTRNLQSLYGKRTYIASYLVEIYGVSDVLGCILADVRVTLKVTFLVQTLKR